MFRRLGLFKRMIGTLGSGPRAKKCMVAVCGIGPHVDKRVQKHWKTITLRRREKWCFGVFMSSLSLKSPCLDSFFSLSAHCVSQMGPFRKPNGRNQKRHTVAFTSCVSFWMVCRRGRRGHTVKEWCGQYRYYQCKMGEFEPNQKVDVCGGALVISEEGSRRGNLIYAEPCFARWSG